MNRALGLDGVPIVSTVAHSDHVLSGELVLPLRVKTSISSRFCAFQESFPYVEMASVSLTMDSYVPEVASASLMLKSFPMLAVAA